jgi:hypothetical protein
MSRFSEEEKALYFLNANYKISVIASVSRCYLINAEEFARGYAQALAETGVLTFDQRDKIYDLAADAVKKRRHVL